MSGWFFGVQFYGRITPLLHPKICMNCSCHAVPVITRTTLVTITVVFSIALAYGKYIIHVTSLERIQEKGGPV